MKKVIVFFIFLIPLIILFVNPFSWNLSFSRSVCDKPIKYRVDTVDPRFNLSKEEFLEDINEAVSIWENSIKKDLFVYDLKGDLSINLIYDDRQTLNNQIRQLENQVRSEKQNLNPQIDQYEKLSSDFKQDLNTLNQEIKFWNNQGGAPPEKYNEIITKQKTLQDQADRLSQMAQQLNISTRNINTQISELNSNINNFNEALEDKPEEGIYKGPVYRPVLLSPKSESIIEVYFNINKDELVHTLAHELGHALTLKHNNNPKAIMYYKTSKVTIPATEDLQSLGYLCRQQTITESIQNDLSQIFPKIIAPVDKNL